MTSTARLHDFVARHSVRNIEYRAVDELRTRHPEFSAGVGRSRRLVVLAYLALAVLAAFAVPGAALMAAELMLDAVFLAWTGLRLLGLLSERFVRHQSYTFSDSWLPTYSIVIALYQEAAAVPDLVAALRALNYSNGDRLKSWREQIPPRLPHRLRKRLLLNRSSLSAVKQIRCPF